METLFCGCRFQDSSVVFARCERLRGLGGSPNYVGPCGYPACCGLERFQGRRCARRKKRRIVSLDVLVLSFHADLWARTGDPSVGILRVVLSSHLRRGGAHAVFLGSSCVSMQFWSVSESTKIAALTVGTACRSGGREKVEEPRARI